MLRLSGEEDRLDNLAELKQAIFDYEARAGEDVTLAAYLDHAALFTNMDSAERLSAVKLMTVHAAKGLEFPAVFVCGLSEGIFPSKRTDTREKLEEERRLCYVAFTRAKDRLFLSDAAGTNYDGSFRYPSRFLFNAEQENLDYVQPLPQELVEDARRAAAILLDRGVKNVVITLGVAGAFWTDGTASCHVPGIPVKAVETTGAGDTFNGALAVAIAEGHSPEYALRFANAAAALSVTRLGAAASAPRRDEILSFMEKAY